MAQERSGAVFWPRHAWPWTDRIRRLAYSRRRPFALAAGDSPRPNGPAATLAAGLAVVRRVRRRALDAGDAVCSDGPRYRAARGISSHDDDGSDLGRHAL